MTDNNQPDQEKKTDDEHVLELTNEVTETPQDASEEIDEVVDPLAATIELEDGFDDDDDDIDPAEDDFVDSLGMEIGTDDEEDEEAEFDETAAEPSDAVLSEGIDISGDQIDAALERVVKKMFYDKIDSILIEVIEKTVSKEIERIKKILTEEVSGD